MGHKKIKTDVAAIGKNSRGEFVVCLKTKAAVKCFYFDRAEQLREALESKQISAGKWIIAAPVENCICKELSLPAENFEQAVRMVEFELESLLPLPANQLVYGCSAIKTNSDIITLMVYILKLSVLESICSPYKELGVVPGKISVDNAAISCWFNGRRAVSAVNIDILIDQDICLILFSVEGNLYDRQRINLKNENDSCWIGKVEKAIDSLNKRLSENRTSSVTIAGGSENVDKLKDVLKHKQDSFAIEKITVIKTPIPNSLAGSKNKIIPPKCCLPAVLTTGLIESIEDDRLKYLDLVPRYQREKARRKKLIINSFAITMLSATLLVSLWLCLQAMNWRIDKHCRELQAQILPIEHIAEKVESKRQKLKAIQKQFAGRGIISQIFHELYKFSPSNISISQLNFKSKTDSAIIDIKGQSDSLSDAFEYADSMEQAPLLKKINITNVQQSPVAGGSIVEFKANCIIRSN
ncbi:MAG: PilN domain-containing protein [Planctomycetes bacterium]|nr:PilN domain-containing protein [Planctomycetota bacterium]